MMRLLFKALSLYGLYRAIRGGPGALAKREARRKAHGFVRRALR
jgi:hypothetical protein